MNTENHNQIKEGGACGHTW